MDNVFEKFMTRFPKINDEINKNLQDCMVDKNDGIYIVWGLGVMPCINRIIDNMENNDNILLNIFDFFEDMANGDDEELKELLMYSTLETLGDDKKRLNISRQYMMKETKNLSDKVEAFLGR
jgi:hypothetical protein